jgi:hypothetical protein
MSTQIARPGTTSVAYDEGRESGLVIYASVLLGMLGLFNLLDGITAIAKSSVFVVGARYVVGDVRAWGWAVLIIGALQLLAAAGVVGRNQLARWFGVAVLGVNSVVQMFFIPSYPFWSLLIIAVDVVGLYALCAFGGKN